jgi:hypothetical protein
MSAHTGGKSPFKSHEEVILTKKQLKQIEKEWLTHSQNIKNDRKTQGKVKK